MSQQSQVAVDATSSVKRQVRGSALLLTGRSCSILLNLVTQILIVRILARTEYGHLAFALSIVEMLALATAFSLDKSLSRFGAIYHERQDRPRLAGSLIVCGGIPLGLGLTTALAIWLAPTAAFEVLRINDAASRLLVLAVVLVPASAFASVTMSLLNVIQGARAVFYRKHLLGPALKLALVIGVVIADGGTMGIVLSLVGAGICGLVTDFWLVIRLLRREGLLSYFSPRRVVLPVREIFSFCVPLLLSDLAYFARGTLVVVLLGWLGTADGTAAFRAVLPVVKLNELVIVNFAFMFTPLASRLFAQHKTVELWELYHRTSLWIMVLSFPIYAGCVCLAEPLTIAMFGESYQDSALLLTVLAYAYFLQATFGFSSLMLKVTGRVKVLMATDILASLVTLASVGWATPIWGPVGAAVAAGGGTILHCVLKSLALRFGHAPVAQHQFNVPKVATFLVASSIALTSLIWTPGWLVGIALAMTASVLVLWCSLGQMQTEEMFPELARFSMAKWLFAAGHSRRTPTIVNDSKPNRPTRIAYIMSRFPKLTETFILREMIEMERLGVYVGVYPLQRERSRVVHPEAAPFVARAYFAPIFSWRVFLANVRCLLRQPVNYVSTWMTLVQANMGSPRYLGGALLFFPKIVLSGERMRQDGIQHVHAHFASHPAMAAWVIHRLEGIPYSFTAHGSDLHRDQHMLREKVRDAAFVVAISNYNRQLIIDRCGPRTDGAVHVVHCGIDPTVFPRRQHPTSFEQGLGPFQIACVGTLHEVKGQSHLLVACDIVRQSGRRLICNIVGSGPDRARLEALAAKLDIAKDVRFHGSRTAVEIRELLANSDAIVAPSVPTRDGRREGIPVVLMEGMGSGLPAVASDLSGIPELVQHELTGLLTAPGDAQAIAQAIIRLMDDAALRQRLALAGHELVSAGFDSGTNARRLLELIEKSLSPIDILKCSRGEGDNERAFIAPRQEEACLT